MFVRCAPLRSFSCPALPPRAGCRARRRLSAAGATLVECVIVIPLLLLISLVLIQYALLFHARSVLTYALFEGARSGSVSHADPAAIETAFTRAMSGYHGGGRNSSELAAAQLRAQAERRFVRIEMLAPNSAIFDDFHSPELAARLGLRARVIPNDNLAFLHCPLDRPGCGTGRAGSAASLLEANLLRLRVTYGIAPDKQIPLAGRLLVGALAVLDAAGGDAFKSALIDARRIPIVTELSLRMQSPAIESDAGSAADTADHEDSGGSSVDELPLCPITQPACTHRDSDEGSEDEDAIDGSEDEQDESENEDPSPVEGDAECHPLLDPDCARTELCTAPGDWLAGEQP